MAYDVKDFQLSGGPGWLSSDRYDLDAKATPTPGREGMILQRRRLQNLLHERFNLTLHRETKVLPIYELTVAKAGLKIQPLKDGSCVPFDTDKFRAPGADPMSFCGYGGFGRGFYEAASTSMAELADSLSMAVDRIVVDKTGIKGVFRVHLTYESMPRPLATTGDPGNAAPAVDSRPSIFTAVQEQLGLKLESTKGPVEVLVIDHAERPSEN